MTCPRSHSQSQAEPRIEARSADSPSAPTPSKHASCLITESAWVRFTLISAGAFCLNNSQLWTWKILWKFQVWLLLLKSHFLLSFLKKKKSQKTSIANQNLVLILLLLLWTQEFKSLSLSDFLPLHNSFHANRSYCHPLSSNTYYCSAGSRSRKGANLWGSEHKISHNSIEKTENCCQKCKLLFCLKKKITLSFKDNLLRDDSIEVNAHALYVRIFVLPHPPRILASSMTVLSRIWRLSYQMEKQ